jgi:hypothetical protein
MGVIHEDSRYVNIAAKKLQGTCRSPAFSKKPGFSVAGFALSQGFEPAILRS